MPRTFLLLGGHGPTGRTIARLLLAETSVRIVLAGRSTAKAVQAAEEFDAQFPGTRVTSAFADASDPRSLRSALEGTDLVIVASPTTQHTRTVAREALAAGADYLDIQLSTHNKLGILQGMAPEIERAGRCFITEAGFHPGLPSALVRHLALSFDRLDQATVAGLLNLGASLPYTESIDELVEMFRNPDTQVYSDGRWQASRWWGMLDTVRIDFGPPFGRRYCAPMMFEEMRSIPERIPSLRRTGVYVAGFNWVADALVFPAMMAALAVSPEKAGRPMGRLLVWAVRTFSSPPYGLVLKAQGTGIRDGKAKTVEVVLAHEDGYLFTASPVVSCLLQYLDGSLRQPGLWMMGHVVDTVRLLGDMERMGIRIRTREAG